MVNVCVHHFDLYKSLKSKLTNVNILHLVRFGFGQNKLVQLLIRSQNTGIRIVRSLVKRSFRNKESTQEVRSASVSTDPDKNKHESQATTILFKSLSNAEKISHVLRWFVTDDVAQSA